MGQEKLIVDNSALVAVVDSDDRYHSVAVQQFEQWEGRLILSPLVLAEADYFASRLGLEVELQLFEDIAANFELAVIEVDDVVEATELCRRYGDLMIGITDASLVVLAKHYETNYIFTFDRRHFSTIEPLQGGSFELLPA